MLFDTTIYARKSFYIHVFFMLRNAMQEYNTYCLGLFFFFFLAGVSIPAHSLRAVVIPLLREMRIALSGKTDSLSAPELRVPHSFNYWHL